jgi:hypothetical protein
MIEDKMPLNDKNQCHGFFEVYWSIGVLAFRGEYINDREIGLWLWYDKHGYLTDKTYWLK